MGIKYIIGDLVETAGNYDVVAHGCNCFCTMGAGIAKAIKKKYYGAYAVDKKTKYGDVNKLGSITTYYDEDDDVTIINAYIQHHYKGADVLVEYSALRSCLKEIKEQHAGQTIGLPLIGCGLAGGDWGVVEGIIKDELRDEDVTVIIFNESQIPLGVIV